MNENTSLTYNDIQSIIIYLVTGLHMPISAKQFVQVLSKELEIGSPQLLNGIIEVCLDQEYFYEFNDGILYDEEALSSFIELPSDFHHALIAYLPQFYKEACSYYEGYKLKHNLVYLPEFINTHYRGILDAMPGKIFMDRLICNIYEDTLSNQFFVEWNDYDSIYGMWHALFDREDSMIKLKGITFNKITQVASIDVFLIPSSNGKTTKATKQYEEFKAHIGEYFNCKVVTHPIIMKISKQRGKKNVSTTR